MNKKRFFSGSSDLFLFRERSLMAVAAVVSLLLQIISFFTTLDGAKAYFAATFAYAPLLFALAVQSVVYFLENGLRRRVSPAKVAALVMAICCSSYFSFVGIYNNVNPPSQYLERTYNGYVKELNFICDGIVSEKNAEYSSAIDSGMNYIIGEYTTLSSQQKTLEALAQELDSAENETVYGMAQPYRWEYSTYEEYAQAYSAYISSFSQSSNTERQAKLEAVLNKYGIEDVSEISRRTADIAADLSLIEGAFAYSQGESFRERAENLRNMAKSGDKQAAESISALYRSLSGEALDVPAYLPTDGLSLVLPDYAELAAQDTAAVVRERLISTVSAACSELEAASVEICADNYTFENVYTLPVHNLVSGDFGADAVVSLLLAILVDVMSLMFAMIFVQNKSILSVSDTAQASLSDSLLFERNIVMAVRIGMSEGDTALSKEPELNEVMDKLGEFINRFSAVGFAVDKGFTMAALRSDISEYEALTAFLCQFGLAQLLSAEEMSLLSGTESGESVLLKTKFLLWLSEKCQSEASARIPKKAVTE
ncbi:MAG: hypothetical protein ACI4KA_07965 [Oscillospiraceae bacterium]